MTDLSTVADLTLLRRMSAGDEEAFTALYRRRHPGIYRFALQMSGSEGIAEDVTQEVCLLLTREECACSAFFTVWRAPASCAPSNAIGKGSSMRMRSRAIRRARTILWQT